MENNKPERFVTSKVIIDFFLLIIVCLPTLIFFLIHSPYKRGFFCDDESISHPYKDSTISDAVLIIVGIGLPTIIVIGAEIFLFCYRKRQAIEYAPKQNRFKFVKWRVNKLLAEMYIHIGMFLFGAAACQGTTDIMKYSIGRLRPHFLDVCKPDYSAFNCTDDRGYMMYIEEPHCTGEDERLINEARLSHPSGHASLSAYCMIFLVFYLEKNFQWKGSKLLKRVIQIVFLYLTLYCGLSRISDYKHHWSDVLMGFALGTLVAVIIALHCSGMFKQPTASEIAKQMFMLEQVSNSSGQSDQRPLSSGQPTSNENAAYRRNGNDKASDQSNDLRVDMSEGEYRPTSNTDWI